ncbi:glycosyltransferase [Polaribacter marinivivus]|uniref:Glycosyltransferase n=1 Tax=Polaribacter marinivivus TaxID=1524260 RepID=A0ABV8RB84_9FLAO
MNNKSPLVLLHQGIMTSYRIPGYLKLLKAIKGLKVLYGQPQKHSSLQNGEIPDNGKFIRINNIYLSKKREFFIANIFNIVLKKRPKVIVTQYSFSNLSIWGLYILRPFFRFKIIGWNHGWDRRTGFHPESSLKDKLRLFMLKKADAMIFYSEDAPKKLSKYINSEKLFVANNTLDTEPLLNLKKKFKSKTKKDLKNELGFITKYNLIFTARLEPEKKPEKLLEIFELLQEKLIDISLHIIGSGPLEKKLKEIIEEKNIKNIKLYGAIYNNELTGKMIYCSDLMIIPSWLGLSIVHSFCFDCPLVTFEKEFHPPEIIYLKDGKTGYNLWDKTNEESVTIIIDYLKNEKLQNEFKNNIKNVIENEASIDKFVQGATGAINYCLKNSIKN